MKPAACIETSVVSYLTARPSRDLVTAAYRQVTREWWDTAESRFSLTAIQGLCKTVSAGGKAGREAGFPISRSRNNFGYI